MSYRNYFYSSNNLFLTLSDFLYYISDIGDLAMSDGPHKSLGMRPGWKKFAKRADKAAYEPDQVKEALPDALGDDWRAERCGEARGKLNRLLEQHEKEWKAFMKSLGPDSFVGNWAGGAP
jgi:hypothetical protein